MENIKKPISITDNKTIHDIEHYNEIALVFSGKVSTNTKEVNYFLNSDSNLEEILECTTQLVEEKNNLENIKEDTNPEIIEEIEIKDERQEIENKNVEIIEEIQINDERQEIENKNVEIIEEIQIKDEPQEIEEKIPQDISTEGLTENTLIISETDEKVILPYTINELKEILKDNSNKYSSLKQIVDDLYTKPIKYYRNFSSSRFREAYKLIKQKESGSVLQALDLAIELFSNYNLHPAIITACKNLNELDIYLSCLEYNELDDFRLFKINFIVPPTTLKKDAFQF